MRLEIEEEHLGGDVVRQGGQHLLDVDNLLPEYTSLLVNMLPDIILPQIRAFQANNAKQSAKLTLLKLSPFKAWTPPKDFFRFSTLRKTGELSVFIYFSYQWRG